jgi:hypothetical protein
MLIVKLFDLPISVESAPRWMPPRTSVSKRKTMARISSPHKALTIHQACCLRFLISLERSPCAISWQCR